MAIFYVLMVFLIIAALVAVETKKLLSAVICVGAVGFGISLMFLFLRAPDIAITQIVVEVLGLIILIRACLSRDTSFVSGGRDLFGTAVSAAIIFVIFMVGVQIFQDMPAFGTAIFTVAPDAASVTYLDQGLQKTGAANIVSAIILDFRAYDTLGEVTVLFTTILGATVILRKTSKKLPQELDK